MGVEEVDRALFPPEVTRVFARARDRAGRAPAVLVEVRTEPAGAAVEVDGRPAGVGPAEVSVRPGRHALVARRPGYGPAALVVDLPGDGSPPVLALDPAGPEDAAAQVGELRREGLLDGDDPAHRGLVTTATGAGRVALVARGGEARLLDAAGEPVPWPEPPAPEDPGAGGEGGEGGEEPAPEPATPLVRQWWLWVSVVGAAALVATGVGLGVHYGTTERDTFTLVPGPRP